MPTMVNKAGYCLMLVAVSLFAIGAAQAKSSYVYRIPVSGVSAPCEPGSAVFTYTGSPQHFTVPGHCRNLTITLAGGDSGSAGNIPTSLGQQTEQTVSLPPGNQVTIILGAGGGVTSFWDDNSKQAAYLGLAGGGSVIRRQNGTVLLNAAGGGRTATVSQSANHYWRGQNGWAIISWGGAKANPNVPGKQPVPAPENPVSPAEQAWTQYLRQINSPVPDPWSEGFKIVLPPPYVSLPSKAYPASEISGSITLSLAHITNVGGLSNLTSVDGTLDLSSNQLTNVSGLSNLTSVGGTLNLLQNPLTNVDGLSNLISVGGKILLKRSFLSPHPPYLADLSGLSGITSLGGDVVLISSEVSITNPVPSDAWLCQPAQTDKFKGISQAEACAP